MTNIEETKEWKEQMLEARISQAKAKIHSIEIFTKQMWIGGESARIASEEIRTRREALKTIKAEAEKLAAELGKTNFSWSEELKRREIS